VSGPSGPASGVPSQAPDDDALLRALADAVAVADPVPADWQRAALGCVDWLALDARLAEMAYDSLDDHRPAGTAHGTARQEGSERRRLRFTGDDLAVEVELNVTADAVRLAGRVLPAGRAGRAAPRRVRALLPQASYTAEVGDGGAFRFDELPHGPVSLLVDGDPAVKTGWIMP
jgi:hypothetical protein